MNSMRQAAFRSTALNDKNQEGYRYFLYPVLGEQKT